jgi:hypothetical protein
MKRLLVITIVLFISLSSFSQAWKVRRFEVWGGPSVFQFYGDIGGSASANNLYGLKDIKLNSTRPGFNIGASFRLEERIYLHGTNTFGILAASDKNSRNSSRGYAFSAIADELAIQGVFFLIKENQNYYYSIMKKRGGLNKINRPLSVYVFAGLGGLFYKTFPKDNLIGSPRFKSQSISLVAPVGLGAKLAFSPKVSYSLELGARYAFSDQLDGLNTQFSKFNDLYYIINFKVIYRLYKGRGLKQIFR